MNGPLLDRRLVRRLRLACVGGGARLRRGRREAGSRRSGDAPATVLVARLAVAALIGAIGWQVHDRPLAAQFIALMAIAGVQIGVERIRGCLHHDPGLAVLAQLPVAPWRVFDHQMRAVWRAAAMPALDAAVFWAVAWSRCDGPAPWALLPPLALTHALLVLASALWLVRVLPAAAGCAVALVVLPAGWAIAFSGGGGAWAWPYISPVLELVRAATPWGWLAELGRLAPREPGMAAAGILALAAMATLALAWGRARLRAEWRPDPLWQEAAGASTRVVPDDDDGEDDGEGPAVVPGQRSPLDAGTALQAWRTARAAPAGAALLASGWADRRAHAHLDRTARTLVDLLRPRCGDDATWRWAVALAGVPLVGATLGWTGGWPLLAVAAAALAARRRRHAMLAGATGGAAFLWPGFAAVAFAIPCAIALLLVVPRLGGTWNGLPMAGSPLGLAPRDWSTLLRTMRTVDRWRQLAALPIVALALAALGLGLHPAVAAPIGMLWLFGLLSTRSWIAWQLVRRRHPGGSDLSCGRWWLTSLVLLLFVAQIAALVALVLLAVLVADGILPQPEALAVTAIIALAGLPSLTAALTALLRRAWRRHADLVPPR